MNLLVYELCENNRSTWGYGVFSEDGIRELDMESVLALVDTGQVNNAEIVKSKLVIKNCDSPLPKFYTSDYEPLIEDCPIYAVCTCQVNGKKGYLVISPLCRLEFVTRQELINLCQTMTVCNVYLKPLYRGGVHPVQRKMPFKYIGVVNLT